MSKSFNILYSKSTLILVVMVLSLSSCFKEDEPIILPPAVNTVSQIAMGPDYEEMVYYDFSTNTSYSRDLKTWDLAFSFIDGSCAIHLNGGKGMYAGVTEIEANFKPTIDLNNVNFRWDGSSGNKDSTAIGDWKAAGNMWNVYVIDRGPYYTDEDERYRKVVFYAAYTDYYTIYYSDMKGKDVYTINIPKYEGKNFSYFTFDKNGYCIDLEPHKDDWDIVFTRGIHTFYETTPPLPYIVTTVLINPNNVWAAADSVTGFNDIDVNKALSMQLSNNWDVIGWDWKQFDQTLGLYTVSTYKNYVIKDGEGSMYKMRFLDFYDKNRQRGYPKFEFTRIK